MTKISLFASTVVASILLVQSAGAANWTGIYIGAHAGGAWGDVDVTGISEGTNFVNYGIPPVTVPFSVDGVLGGGQLGFNYQWSNFLLGVEGTFSGLDFDETILNPLAADQMSVDIEWLATAALRLGGSWYDCLWYVKGGYATGDVHHRYDDTIAGGDPAGFYETDETHHGYVVGGGIEHLIGDSVSFGVEYNYIDLGETDHSTTGSTGGAVLADVDAQIHTVTARLNWHLYRP